MGNAASNLTEFAEIKQHVSDQKIERLSTKSRVCSATFNRNTAYMKVCKEKSLNVTKDGDLRNSNEFFERGF